VEVSEPVAADLLALTRALALAQVDLESQLRDLARSVAQAVNSYRGFAITLIVDDCPLNFVVFEDDPGGSNICASLQLPLSALGPYSPEAAITFYAATPGALVDLAADLSYALRLDPGDVRLDSDLVPPESTADGVGLDELTVRNQAIGVLLDRGHTVEQARSELDRQARSAGLTPLMVAQRVIASTTPDGCGTISS
jgi:hypothetical protein